jgi:hypothetical protein
VAEMTVQEYDIARVKEFVKQSLISVCILLFLHYKYEFIQPLLIQAILPLKSAFSLPIFQIHLFRKSAEGPLKRPFKPPASPFAGLMEGKEDEDLTKSEKKKAKKAAAALLTEKPHSSEGKIEDKKEI